LWAVGAAAAAADMLSSRLGEKKASAIWARGSVMETRAESRERANLNSIEIGEAVAGSKDDWIVRIAIEMERSDWEKPIY
jgi:hypothetical protein